MKATIKVENGKLIEVSIKKDKKINKISEIKITGDFFMHPEESIWELEKSLTGITMDKSIIQNHIEKYFSQNNIKLIGISKDDLLKCIEMALNENN